MICAWANCAARISAATPCHGDDRCRRVGGERRPDVSGSRWIVAKVPAAEDLATRDAFARDPALVWEWYAWRREKVAACRPNAAHDVLARWSQRDRRSRRSRRTSMTCTSRAGTRDLIRLHGSLWELKCFNGCATAYPPWRDERVPLPDALPPACPHCGGHARPAVVWFGESLERGGRRTRRRKRPPCDVFLTVGTSAVVLPGGGVRAPGDGTRRVHRRNQSRGDRRVRGRGS